MERDLLTAEIGSLLTPLVDREGASIPATKPTNIWLNDTDLDAPYSGGNFNFLFNGGATARITLNVYLDYKDSFTAVEKNDFVTRLYDAVGAWDGAAEVQISDKNKAFTTTIKLEFKLKIVQQKNHANKIIEVYRNATREKVLRSVILTINTSVKTMAHELGHVWGLEDEYDAKGVKGWFQKRMPMGHVGPNSPLLKDKKALLNLGDEFRGRYFVHIGRALLKSFRNIDTYRNKNVFKGKTVSYALYGRIKLLKKDIYGASPYTSDQPLNPVYTTFQISYLNKDNEYEVGEVRPSDLEVGVDGALFYEDVVVRANETILMLAAAYGYDPDDWREIWNHPKNAALVNRRKTSDNIRVGDKLYIPIKWQISERKLDPSGTTFTMTAKRDGKQGDRLSWVQTVYGHNQPSFNDRPLPAFSVDWPNDDDKPFYWTQAEIDNADKNDGRFPTIIFDTPNRNAPTVAMGATGWRAVTSLCVTTGKRVSIWNTFVWGINFMPDGKNTPYAIRPATKEEIAGHLNLLHRKLGRSKRSFQSMGWTFRSMNT